MIILKRLLIIIALIVVAVSMAVITSAIVCGFSIRITDYDVQVDGLANKIKIACISDLHEKEYGKDNENLVALIARQNPDAIMVNGDMIERNASEDDIEKFLDLLKELLEIAPVYYSTGNHEVDYMNEHGEELLNRISKTGAVALYDSFIETTLEGNTIRIGGTCGHYRSINWEKQYDYEMLREIGSTDVPAIVMNHMPENIICDPGVWDQWTGDLYLCAHTHGGVIQIPGIGGLFAPTQRWFPEYDKGRYLIGDKLDVIITSGLSGYKGVPRIFNMPEICVVNLVPN